MDWPGGVVAADGAAEGIGDGAAEVRLAPALAVGVGVGGAGLADEGAVARSTATDQRKDWRPAVRPISRRSPATASAAPGADHAGVASSGRPGGGRRRRG